MKMEIGKKYYRKGYSEAGILILHGFNVHGDAIVERPDGNIYKIQPHDFSQWDEYVEPRKGVGYVNVYDDGIGLVYSTRFDAIVSQSESRKLLARVKVEWTEGQFDD